MKKFLYFFSAAWFLLPLVMLLAFYKHFFLFFRSTLASHTFHGDRERMYISRHRLLHVPDTHCVDERRSFRCARVDSGDEHIPRITSQYIPPLNGRIFLAFLTHFYAHFFV